MPALASSVPHNQDIDTDLASQRSAFGPIFTIVRDAATNEHFHPGIEYCFNDDDPENLSGAIASSLEQRVPEPSLSPTCCHILVDLDSRGQGVVAYKSLAPDWQCTAASLTAAPTFANGNDNQQTASRMMLQLDGCARLRFSKDRDSRTANEDDWSSIPRLQERLQNLTRQYSQAMNELKHWSQL